MEQVAKTDENYLLCGEIKDAFASFQQLKQKCATSAPLKALDGKLLSDRASVAARWQEHLSTLLNRPIQSPPDALVSEAQASTPDSTIDTFTLRSLRSIKPWTRSRQARHQEYAVSIQSTSNTVAVICPTHSRTLHKIVTRSGLGRESGSWGMATGHHNPSV